MIRALRISALTATRAAADGRSDWACAAAILVFAALIRLAFFRGALGSDEIVYITRAHHLLNDEPMTATYIGALRYGINLFQALSIKLFGNGVAGADGLFFACSLAQILLAYTFANHLWGRPAAIWSALALATAPLDVTLAGSLNPDPYLALVISSSIVIFYLAQQEDQPARYLAAGLLAGWVFWIKEAVIIYGGVFLLFALSDRRWRNGWWLFVLAAALSLLAHFAVFWLLYGDPFYLFKILHHTVEGGYVAFDIADTSFSTYFILLLAKIYHMGLLGWLALAGGILALLRRGESGIRFVAIWAFGLLVIFSAFPISFSPLKFVAKQANYMEIFVMPLALLAGWFLAQQQRAIMLLLGGAMALSGVALSALEQQAGRVVIVNGPPAAAFARNHDSTPVFGPLTLQRQSTLERLLRGSLDGGGDIRPMSELQGISLRGGSPEDVVAYIIEDPQMRNWPDARTEGPLSEKFRQCLVAFGRLEPRDPGLGRWVVAALRSAISLLPAPYAATALPGIDPLWRVEPAQVYAVTRECARNARTAAAGRQAPLSGKTS
jgi:hypothetical protein